MQPLISVIVPVYNVEKYLNKCIDSIVKQTYTNLEIILVDDGSPDNCPAMCDEWANKDSRIKVIHKENGRETRARNAGLNIMTGTLVGFIDSDDYILPEMYENLYNALIENDADLSICSYSRVDENDNPIPRKNKMKESIKVVSRNEALSSFITSPFAAEYGVLWTKLYKSEIFNGLRFPTQIYRHEDTATIHRIIGACNKIVLLNQVLYVYRKNSNGLTGTLKRTKFDIREFHDRKFIAFDRYNYYMSINRPDLAKTAWKTAHFALAYTLKRVNYLEI
ncbi:MAG: glycosyltransferase [Synergistaceae bacterium]|nr:glycosyltransferase [Synergistaceae bacterium]